MEHATLTRRGFMKSVAAAGAALAAAGSAELLTQADEAYAQDSHETKIVRTCCRACISQCTVLAHVRDGRVIKLEGDPEGPLSRGAMCAKGLSGLQALYNPMRNKYPMKRVGERGTNNWERMSWDEATDLIADKLMEAYEKYGPEALFTSTGGGGNPHISGPVRFNQIFGSPNNFEPGCAQCYLPRICMGDMITGQGGFYNLSLADSNCIELYFPDTEVETVVLWGTDPSWSSPAMGGQALSQLFAREQGLKTVVIDPRFTADAAKAEVWLPIRPGTDVALMMCWERTIIEEKLYDAEFVRKWTNFPALVDPETQYLLRADVIGGSSDNFVVWDEATNAPVELTYPYPEGVQAALEGTYEVNGVHCETALQVLKDACDPYTIEKAAEICWLDADKIRKAIDLYAASNSTICHGVATDQAANSSQAALASLQIEILMGHVEKPGSVLQRFGELTDPSGVVDDDTYGLGHLTCFVTDDMVKNRLGATEHKGLHFWEMAHIPTVLEAIKTGKPYKPRIWIERSGNKLAMLGNARSWAEAIPEIDFAVHLFVYPTSFTVEVADVILPTEEWLEMGKPVQLANKVFVRQPVAHIFETADESICFAKILEKLAKRGHKNAQLCFDKDYIASWGTYASAPPFAFPEVLTEAELHQEFTNQCKYTYDELCAMDGPYEYAPFDEWRRYNVYSSIDPDTGKPRGFGTKSKLLEPYNETMVRIGREGGGFVASQNGPVELPPASVDYKPVPYYLEPDESPLTDTDYPLVLTCGRLPYYHHGTLRNIPWLREIYPVAEVWVNPADAQKYGIEDGHWVRVESRRGETYAKARVTEEMGPGMLYQERFWNPELLDTDAYGSWNANNYNVLSRNDAPFNDEFGTYTLRGFQVKITQVDANPYDIWTEPEQFSAWLPEPSDTTEAF